LSEPRSQRSAELSVSLGVFTLDASLAVRSWDEWLERVSGIRAADAHGRQIDDVVPSIAARGLLDRFRDVLSSGCVHVLAPAFHEYLIPCRPPRPSAHFAQMQQRVTLGPLREGQQIVGVMVTLEDVTERLDAERELARALQDPDAATREAAAARLAKAEHLEDPRAFASALRDDDWRVRRAAVEGLTRHADRETLAHLLTVLRTEHRDFNVLSSALQLFAASDVDVTSSLIALLDDPDTDLRIQAALALGEQEHPGGAEALIRALNDPDTNVRFHAIEALGRLRAGEAIDALAAIAESGDFFLAFPAIEALARIGDGRVSPRLVPLLESAELRDPVAGALGELGDTDAVDPLVKALNTSSATMSIVRALARLHDRYDTQFAAGSYIVELFQQSLTPAGAQRILDLVPSVAAEDARSLVLVLGWLRGAAVERALTRLLGRAQVRSEAIEAIVRQGAGIIDLLIEQLDDADEETRIAAITALGSIGNRRATEALSRALSEDRRIAVAAAGALASIGDRDAFEPLLALLRHSDVVVRMAAVAALNSIGHPDMAGRVEHLLQSPDATVRESAVRIAGYFGYSRCLPLLLERCSDADESVRKAALEQLPHLDDARALAILARAIHKDTAPARASAAQALGRLDDPSALALLLEAAGDDDAWVRYFAARAIGRHGGDEAIGCLARLAKNDRAMQVRIAAIEALGAIGSAEALEALLPYAADVNEEIAAAALRAIGHAESDIAMEALARGLRSGSVQLRLAAVDGLAQLSTPARIESLAWTAAADENAGVSAAAFDGLVRLGRSRDEGADAAIAALTAMTADAQRRERAIAALSEMTHRIPTVAAGLRAPDTEVRRATVEALGRMQHGDASAAIRGALEDPEAAVRQTAVIVLDRLRARGLAQTFATMAREDPSRAVRRAASAALGHAGAASDSDGLR
jgi:HEAT repeat protein